VSAPRFKLGIGTLAIAGAGLVIAAGIGGLSVLVVNAHRAALLEQIGLKDIAQHERQRYQ